MKKIISSLIALFFIVSVFGASKNYYSVTKTGSALFKSNHSLKFFTTPDQIRKGMDLYCTSGTTYIENGGYTITCTRCSSVSMFDAQTQVADCLMDARLRNAQQ